MCGTPLAVKRYGHCNGRHANQTIRQRGQHETVINCTVEQQMAFGGRTIAFQRKNLSLLHAQSA